ncbi:transcriptional regulator [Streptomyces erythrochromogenes]|uniref:transcriptional regulator n=1 Tax=Streptomyces erythrochromogenes TaxID=285574 RepID=UPI0037F1D494
MVMPLTSSRRPVLLHLPSRRRAPHPRGEAGWVAVEKGQVGRRPRTWLRLTGEGSAAYRRHLVALRAIAGPLD